MGQGRLFGLLWLAIAAAIATIALKTTAWLLTGSVGLLSDAAESVVNLVAAVVAMLALRWALKPADSEHAYGHSKAEYFAAGVEGAMIVVAALVIAATALPRLLDPQPIDEVGIGVAISTGASLINLTVGILLVRAGRRERSIVLEADGRHLLTDVWTSAGVLIAVVLVVLTGWNVLDPLIALAVAANIVITGSSLVRRSVEGLMDRGLGEDEREQIATVLARFERLGIDFHAIRTRQAGSRAFISLHVLVPGAWTVQRGHDTVEEIEDNLRRALPHATVFTHLEPAEDPRSLADIELERTETSHATPSRHVEI
jgi:cation diffusion facilitator family transporter